jgi:hypothetical protein
MKVMITTIAAVAALTIGSAAVANPSWTYADLGVVIGDTTGKDNETGAIALRGSFGFGSMWHVGLDLASGEANGGKSNGGSDTFGYAIRGGINPSITDNIDFVLDLGYTSVEDEYGFGTGNSSTKQDTSTIDARTGLRANIGPVELRGFLTLGWLDGETNGIRLDEEGTDISYQMGGQYNFNDAWSVGVEGSFNSIVWGDSGNIYVRWSF